MKIPLLKTFILLLPACVAMSAKADYVPDFSSGKIPDGITVANESGFEPVQRYYRHGWTAEGWILERFGSKGYVMMAPSHTGDSVPKPMRSVFSLPSYDVAEGTWLRWDACSMLPNMAESYAVEIVPEGSDKADILLNVDAESSEWTTRMISLSRYSGRKCRVSFVCTSADRYELMLDKIAITEPSAPIWTGKNDTPSFGDMSGTRISGTVTNFGAPAQISAVRLLDGDGNEIDRSDTGCTVGTSESIPFSFQGKAEKDVRTHYSVSLLLADGSPVAVKDLEGSYFSSMFTRRHLVDKGTGMWCVNCPSGSLQLEQLQRRFGDSLIPVETHQGASDPLANESYFSSLKYYSIPAFRMDRNRKGNNNFNDMEKFYDVPANHDVIFEKVDLSDPDLLGLRVVVRHSAEEASGFRLGYVVTADFSDPRYYQSNNTSTLSGERYYFLPSRIPGELMDFRHVSVTSDHTFEGIEPVSSYVSEGNLCSVFEFSVPRPSLVEDFRAATVVAFPLNESGIVLNAGSVRLDRDFELSAVDPLFDDRTTSDAPAEYYTLQGLRVDNPSCGIFIRRQGNTSSKVIIK